MSHKRKAITIHVVQIGETAWVWELRDLEGALMSYSGSDGEFEVFAGYPAAFGDACMHARNYVDNLARMES